MLSVPYIILTIIMSVVSSVVVFAVSYGKLTQRVKDLEENNRRIEETVTGTKYDIKDLNTKMDTTNKTIYELKGILETFIKLQCMKDGME